MDRWLEFLQKWFFNRVSADDVLCEELDLDGFLRKLMDRILEQTAASGVVWIEASELKNISMHIKGMKYEKAPELVSNQLIKTSNDLSFSNLVDHLKNLDLESEVVQVGTGLALLPVRHFKNHEMLGYMLLTNITLGREKSAAKYTSSLLGRVAKHLGFCLQHKRALGAGFLDDLTGLYNQKYMSLVLENEIHRSARLKSKFSVLFMDIDFFKSVNDSRGHWVGSRLLVELGRIIQKYTRRSDYSFRYGGDEFVVVLPETDQAGALVAAERLRSHVESTEFLIDGVQLNLTLSIGIATYPDHAKSNKEIIQMADQAMYSGKNKSRNIVFMAS